MGMRPYSELNGSADGPTVRSLQTGCQRAWECFMSETLSYSERERDGDVEGLVTIKHLPESRSVQSRGHSKKPQRAQQSCSFMSHLFLPVLIYFKIVKKDICIHLLHTSLGHTFLLSEHPLFPQATSLWWVCRWLTWWWRCTPTLWC